MSIELSVPLLESSYRRTFAAEIDIPAADLLLVRGVLRDHRCAFEHVWQVRTPSYEVVAATATQLAGDASSFRPELCERYAQIAGVRIGRGFSRRVMEALGELPGAQEHLLTAIEMARVGQQVYQFPPGFEEQFPRAAAGTTAAARSAWLKDRAYMPELANSCYTYRDDHLPLFDSRTVRCGFDTAMTRPQPGDKRAFWRNKSVTITRTAAGFACESAMADRIHDIRIGFALSDAAVVSQATSSGARLPYHGICEDAHLRTPGLDGLRVTARFVRQFADQVGGADGCTHLFDLSLDCLRLFRFD